jgi:hypothetical protein
VGRLKDARHINHKDDTVILRGLPDWSEQDDSPVADYGVVPRVAAGLARLGEVDRRAEVEWYSSAFCFPRLSISEASGLYVLLRVMFDLPHAFPLAETKVFGGWIHPSIGKDPFDLSWPVTVSPDHRVATIAPFVGYRGKGYDAVGEYDYFLGRFSIRPAEVVDALRVERA